MRLALRASNTQYCKSVSLKNHIRYRTGIWIASGHDKNFRTLSPLIFKGLNTFLCEYAKYRRFFAVIFRFLIALMTLAMNSYLLNIRHQFLLITIAILILYEIIISKYKQVFFMENYNSARL